MTRSSSAAGANPHNAVSSSSSSNEALGEPSRVTGGNELQVSGRARSHSNPESSAQASGVPPPEELDKVRRSLSKYSLWRSRAELKRAPQPATTMPTSQHERPAPEAGRVSGARRCLSSSISILGDSIIAAHSAQVAPTSIYTAGLDANHLAGGPMSERRLWQSLVMPLVLGCVIFLVAVWTRQISLALTNDTIIMIMILGAIFILMSSVAFWLSRDQQLRPSAQRQQPAACCRHQHSPGCSGQCRVLLDSDPHARNSRHTHRHQQHTCSAHQQRHSGAQQQADDDDKWRLDSGDCLPPDYLSAVRNSLPVSLFCTDSSADLRVAADANPEDKSKSADKLVTRVYLSDRLDAESLSNVSLPPAYGELTLVIEMDAEDQPRDSDRSDL